jgi:serine phosphatase RsbU (regulator of sigma subunit)
MKKIVQILFLFFLTSSKLYSQSEVIDSLKGTINYNSLDTNSVNNLNLLSIEYFLFDYIDSANKYAVKAIELSKKINYDKGHAQGHNILANIYFYQGKYPESLNSNFEALRLRESLRDKIGVANSYNNIGNAYMKMEKTTEALKYHFMSLEIRKFLKDTINLAYSYNNIGNVYQKVSDFTNALRFHNKAYEIRKSLNEPYDLAITLINLGTVYSELGQYQKALQFQNESLNISEDIGDKTGVEVAYVALCFTYYQLKEYQVALQYGMDALNLATEINDIETIVEANRLLSLIYEKIKNFEKSLIYYEEYVILKDSLFSSKNIEKTVQSQLQFEFEKKTLAIQLEHEKKEALALSENKNQLVILIFISIMLVFVILFSLYTYRNYNLKRKANNLIILQKQEVEEQKNIIEEKNLDITSSIKYAKRIQDAILPSNNTISMIFSEFFVLYKPKDIIGGDFYWVSDAITKYQETFAMAAVGDCTGHGVPGALMSIIGNNYLRLCEREPTVNRPSEALDFINLGISKTLRQEYSKSTIQDGIDMVFIAIDYKNSKLFFSGAKNPIYIIRAGILEEYKGDRHPIGAYIGEEMKKFTNHEISIEKGDCIYMFSDGFADQFGGPNKKKFMYSRFKNLLVEISEQEMSEQHKILEATFETWKGTADQVDDVCVFGIRI